MIELPCAADIHCSAETIFNSRRTLVALKAYADTLD